MLAGEIDPLFTRQIKAKEWSENKWVSGWQGSRSLSLGSVSLIRQGSRLQAFPSFVGVPLSCSLTSFMSTIFFVFFCRPCEPSFCLGLFSLRQSSRGRAEASLRSQPSPPSALSHTSATIIQFISLYSYSALARQGNPCGGRKSIH